MTDIIKELSGIPLALEQAGALIREGEFSFTQFHSAYKDRYRELMETRPLEGSWKYEKNRGIMTVLDMMFAAITQGATSFHWDPWVVEYSNVSLGKLSARQF